MDKNTTRLNIEIPKKLKKEIKLYLANNDGTIKEVVVEALEDYLKK